MGVPSHTSTIKMWKNSAYTIRSALISVVGKVQKCVVWDAALDQQVRRV